MEIQVSLFIFTISKEQLNINLSNGDSFDAFATQHQDYLCSLIKCNLHFYRGLIQYTAPF